MTSNGIPQQPPLSGWETRWLTIKGSPRVIVLGLVILCILAVFGYRLWDLQFVQGAYYSTRADWQRLRSEVILTAQGIIYDRDGTPLVRNVPSFRVTITPAYLPDDEAEAEAERVWGRVQDL